MSEHLEERVTQRRRKRLHEEIAAFAEAHAGTDLDLDEDLERAALEELGPRDALDLRSRA